MLSCPVCAREFGGLQQLGTHRAKLGPCRRSEQERVAAKSARRRARYAVLEGVPCPICGLLFRSARSLGMHRRGVPGRANPCLATDVYERMLAAKRIATLDEKPAWYRAQQARKRGGEFACPRCGARFQTMSSVKNHRGGTLACRKTRDELADSTHERKHRFHARHYVKRPPRVRQRRKGRTLAVAEPIPSSPAGHPLYEEARAALNRTEANELGGDFDSIGQDLMQEYVLARVAGEDPTLALQRTRRRHNKDRKLLVYGLGLVDDLRR